MRFTAKYKFIYGFYYIYINNYIISIPSGNPKDWHFSKVGDYHQSFRAVLTQEIYDKWASECKREKEFYIPGLADYINPEQLGLEVSKK